MFGENNGKPPLVFIHGAGGRKEIWSLVAKRLLPLAPAWPLVLVDLPGHGQSPLPGHATIDDYADVILDLADKQGWDAFALGGHSMGGAIAQCVAARQPQRVSHLILAATGGRIPVAPVLFDLLPEQSEAVVVLIKEWGFGPNAPAILVDRAMAPMAQVDGVVMREDMAACRDWEAGDRLQAITAKTLVVAAELDMMVKPKIARDLAESITDARFETLAETGHMMTIEADKELARLIAAFLAE